MNETEPQAGDGGRIAETTEAERWLAELRPL